MTGTFKRGILKTDIIIIIMKISEKILNIGSDCLQ